MSRVANRVGLANSQVDVYGRIKLARKQLTQIIASLPRWTDFNVFKNGTEQILPVNTSEPSTSPIIADIDYPDGRRNNQFFLYRESPTEKYGVAWLRNIKGNTISFNQLVQNGNFADTSNWSVTDNNVTFTASGNIASISVSTGGNYGIKQSVVGTKNHVVFLMFDYYAPATETNIGYFYHNGTERTDFNSTSANVWVNQKSIITLGSNFAESGADLYFVNRTNNSTLQVKNVMLFDLTLMGIDNLTTTAEVEAWLSSHVGDLPYFDYTQGSLISFNGTGLKTTGKNLFDKTDYDKITGTYSGNSPTIVSPSSGHILVYMPCFANTKYTASRTRTGSTTTWRYNIGWVKEIPANGVIVYDSAVANSSPSGSLGTRVSISTTTGADAKYIVIYLCWTSMESEADAISDLIVQIGDATTYEPYTSNTLSLPTLTYFPTGMKSAGEVYDEIDPESNKVMTRIGSVDLGSLTWSRNQTASGYRFQANLSDIVISTDANAKPNMVCSRYLTTTPALTWSSADKGISNNIQSANVIAVDNDYSDVASFTSAMSGVMLYYELDTPTEEPIIELD